MLNMLVLISVIPLHTCNIQHFNEQNNSYHCFYVTHKVNIEHWNISPSKEPKATIAALVKSSQFIKKMFSMHNIIVTILF